MGINSENNKKWLSIMAKAISLKIIVLDIHFLYFLLKRWIYHILTNRKEINMNNKTTNILLAVVFLVAAFFSFRYDQRPIGAFSVVMGVFFLYKALTNKEDVSKEKDYK